MSTNTMSTLSASLTNFFAPESWNKKRSSEKLRSFVDTRLENCSSDLELDFEV
jgi:hypothetical protein